jgi:hypothetical protein
VPPSYTQDTPFSQQSVRDATGPVASSKPPQFGSLSLPMDEASRMARATEQGFTTPAYHGTRSEFEQFGRIDGGNARGAGYYFTESPETASRYATGENVNRITLPGNADPAVMPVRLKTGRVFDENATLTKAELRKVEDLLRADGQTYKKGEFANGFDRAYPPTGQNVLQFASYNPDMQNKIIRALGYDSRRGSDGTIIAFEPSQIRSQFAAFDPANKDSGFLLGSGATDKRTSAIVTVAQMARAREAGFTGASLPIETMKPPKVLYRGIVEGAQESGAKGLGTAHLGRGLYSSSDKSFAKKYASKGEIVQLSPEQAWPSNPLVLRGAGGAGNLLLDFVFKNTNFKNAREFHKAFDDPGDWLKALGYDGVVVNGGEEVVKFGTPPRSTTLGSGATDKRTAAIATGLEAARSQQPAAFGSLSALPMDQASRMQRAAKLGFNTDEPLYRGQPEIDRLAETGEFRPDYVGGRNHSAGAAWFTDNPQVAEQYVPKNWREHGGDEGFREGAGMVPAYTKAKQLDLTAEGMGPDGHKVLQKVYKRIGKDFGFDNFDDFSNVVTGGRIWEHGAGLQFQNAVLREASDIAKGAPIRINDNTYGTPNTSVVVFKPEDIRSPFAAFDPKNKKSGFILGSGATDADSAAIAGGLNAAKAETAPAFGALNAPQPIRAYHGSPYDFDRFDLGKIGTGEGAQTYGHGLYFAENEAVADSYRELLSGFKSPKPAHEQVAQDALERLGSRDAAIRQLEGAIATREAGERGRPGEYLPYHDEAVMARDLLKTGWEPKRAGRTYEVNINAPADRFLDWDAPLAKQPAAAQDFAKEHWWGDPSPLLTGENIYRASGFIDKSRNAEIFKERGIPGIKYLDAGSRMWGDLSALRTNLAKAESKLAEWKNSKLATAPDQRAMYKREIDSLKGNIAKAEAIKPTSNFVVFDPEIIEIVRKYGLTGMLGAGAIANDVLQPAEQ